MIPVTIIKTDGKAKKIIAASASFAKISFAAMSVRDAKTPPTP